MSRAHAHQYTFDFPVSHELGHVERDRAKHPDPKMSSMIEVWAAAQLLVFLCSTAQVPHLQMDTVMTLHVQDWKRFLKGKVLLLATYFESSVVATLALKKNSPALSYHRCRVCTSCSTSCCGRRGPEVLPMMHQAVFGVRFTAHAWKHGPMKPGNRRPPSSTNDDASKKVLDAPNWLVF